MDPLAKFSLKLAIYGSVLAYVAADFYGFHGPMKRWVERQSLVANQKLEEGSEGGVVARVFQFRITKKQLDRAVNERLWAMGIDGQSLDETRARRYRISILNELIDHELLRVKVKANGIEVKVSEEEIAERMRVYEMRFPSKAAMRAALQQQGYGSEQEFKDRLTAQLQQERYIRMRLQDSIAVSDAEAKKWYDEHQKWMVLPERIRVRHVFIATLDKNCEQVREQMQGMLEQLQKKQVTFEELVTQSSEDEHSKLHAGDLGWMSRERLPEDFANQVFAIQDRSAHVVQTRLGWHLLEITDRKGEEMRAFEQVKTELVAALETQKSEEMIRKYREDLRTYERDKIQIFWDQL